MKFVTMIAVASTCLAVAFGTVAYVQHLDAEMYRDQSARDRSELHSVIRQNLEKDKIIANLQKDKDKAEKEAEEAVEASSKMKADAKYPSDGNGRGLLETSMDFASFGLIHVPKTE